MDEEIKQRVFQQIMDIFVFPEIERRRKVNKLPSNLTLNKIQIISSLKSGRNYVRLNEEVKAIIKCKINKSIQKGETIYDKDIEEIESIELTKGDLNYGHFTLLYFKNNWVVSFNFIYNKDEIKKHIEASNEFYESAKENFERKRLRPFFENAFASAELSTKGVILSLPNKKLFEGKNHRERTDFLNNWANLGNVKAEFSTTLSKLYSIRGSARYLSSDNFKKENPKEILLILKEMIDFLENLIN